MRVRVMIPTHRRNRDTVVVFRYRCQAVTALGLALLVVFNTDLMRKILIKIRHIKFVEQAFC